MGVRSAGAAALVVVVGLASCGGSSRPAARTSPTTAVASSAGPQSSSAGASASTTISAPLASGPAAPTAGGPATTLGTPSAANGGAANVGPAPTAAGLYRFRQTGSSTTGATTEPAPAEGTLRVDPAAVDGTQVSHRAVHPDQPPSDTTIAFRPSGMFITTVVTRTTLGTQTVAFTCTFNPGVPAPPWPPAVGKAFSASGSCGSFTAQVTGRIDGTRTVALDGRSLTAYVVDSTIVTHGQVESTQTETDWFSPVLRLSVHSETHSKGTFGAFRFSSDLTSDLESGRPA